VKAADLTACFSRKIFEGNLAGDASPILATAAVIYAVRKLPYSAIAETTIGALRAYARVEHSVMLLMTLIGF